jgi:hypothetical protein
MGYDCSILPNEARAKPAQARRGQAVAWVWQHLCHKFEEVVMHWRIDMYGWARSVLVDELQIQQLPRLLLLSCLASLRKPAHAKGKPYMTWCSWLVVGHHIIQLAKLLHYCYYTYAWAYSFRSNKYIVHIYYMLLNFGPTSVIFNELCSNSEYFDWYIYHLISLV